jgi:serine/threonine-protein kinase RsbW
MAAVGEAAERAGLEPDGDRRTPRAARPARLVNAVVHGNRLDPKKTVHVECEVSPEYVRLEVTDEGQGFDPVNVPDCTLEERLEAPSGRGVMLMRSFMSRITYNAKGNSVVLEKRRGDKPAEG